MKSYNSEETWWTRAHTDVYYINIHGMQLWTAGILRDCDAPEQTLGLTLWEWHESSSTSANAQTQGSAITISCSEFHISISNTGSSLSRAHSGSQVPPLIPIVHRSHCKNADDQQKSFKQSDFMEISKLSKCSYIYIYIHTALKPHLKP